MNPFDHPICFSVPERLVESAWHEHIPFAMFLVDILEPEIIVELGTHTGVSYCAFCQAVSQLNLATRCYAIDTWRGDPHAGFYGPEVLASLRAHHDPLYGGFSTLLQSTFEDALDHFGDGTISLLHIDAYHVYEAVKRDFNSWLPKMNRDGVVVFHDTNVRERDFGVRKFWDEIKSKHQHFEFLHGHGLGVLALGNVRSTDFQDLLNATREEASIIRSFFYHLGNRLELKFQGDAKQKIIDLQSEQLVHKQQDLVKADEGLKAIAEELERNRQAVANTEKCAQSLNADLDKSRETNTALLSNVSCLERALESLSAEVREKGEINRQLIVRVTKEEQISDAVSWQLSQREGELRRLSAEAAIKDQSIDELLSMIMERERSNQDLLEKLQTHSAEVQALSTQLLDKTSELVRINNSMGWRLLKLYGRRIKYPYLLPLYRLYGRIKYPHLLPIYKMLGLAPKASIRAKRAPGLQDDSSLDRKTREVARFSAYDIQLPPPLQAHSSSVDIIVCIHNALEDVKRCLGSVVQHTTQPYSLILVDDGSSDETRQFVAKFAESHAATLIRNEQARGYTFSANQGMQCSVSNYLVLLNSDTIVVPNWLDRMVACAESDSRIAIVGPLSNAATWQSIPEIIRGGEFAENELPNGRTISDMGMLVAKHSARIYPRVPFLNGFCLLIKRQVIDEIGYFDEEAFGRGYGEENDYCIRATNAGWEFAISDDTYVYHAQSRSYSHERRKELWVHAHKALTAKHGQEVIENGVAVCRYDRVLEGIRARSQVMAERESLIEQGKASWNGSRVMFLLPIPGIGGGGNVVLDEAEAMRNMGIDVTILNLSNYEKTFKRDYPDNSVPVIFVNESEIPGLIREYDAVIATWYASVDWLATPVSRNHHPVRGYYVQSFEPYLFSEGSEEFRRAWSSYDRYPDLVRVTKTEWNRAVVKEKTGAECTVVGPSVNIDLYRPRPRCLPDSPVRPLRIAAMVRANSPYRAPEFTIEILNEISRAHGKSIETILFGCDPQYLSTLDLQNYCSWSNAGILTRPQTAYLLNEVDIFVDFSTWQTMGLTAMEAMACGAAVIVPKTGGAVSFVSNEQNGLVVDTNSTTECVAALERLVSNEECRSQLQRQAIFDICHFYREKAALNILRAIFDDRSHTSTFATRSSAVGTFVQTRPVVPSVTIGGDLSTQSQPAGAQLPNSLVDDDRVPSRLSALKRVARERTSFVEQGRLRWHGKRLLFVLPVSERSDGANVVLDEAEAMKKMGVEVSLLNLARYRSRFELNFFDNNLPIIFVDEERDIPEFAHTYDAAIATGYESVNWLASPASAPRIIKGYYIQDFEPNFFPAGSEEFRSALASYTRYTDLIRFTKTEWTRAIVKEKTGVDCTVVGLSINTDTYYPRNRKNPNLPLRICAMIRPSSPLRAPLFTLQILRDFYHAYSESVEIYVFGCDSYDLQTLAVPTNFFHNAGVLTRPQMAALFNNVDVFVDFSIYQAMGLTAMEAMSCGATAIVPQTGGSTSFVIHQENGMLVDTGSKSTCLAALEELLKDRPMLERLKIRAAIDLQEFFPERAAYNILSALFRE